MINKIETLVELQASLPMIKKLETLLELQASFNNKLHTSWFNQDYNYPRAIYVESAELLDHLNYKWWKNTNDDVNYAQAHLELVDILHFGLSELIKIHINSNLAVEDTINDIHNSIRNAAIITEINTYSLENIRSLIDNFVHDASNNHFNAQLFFTISNALNLSFNDMYKLYIGKNALNEFRQLNGYKSGNYIKIWNGKEDNEILSEIINNLLNDEHLYINVLKHLNEAYSKLSTI